MASFSSKVSPPFFLQTNTALSKRKAYLRTSRFRFASHHFGRAGDCGGGVGGIRAGQNTPVLFGPLLLAADLQLSVDLGPTKERQRLSLRARRGERAGVVRRGARGATQRRAPRAALEPHHVLDGQLERGDLPDDLVVSLHLVHALRQVLQRGAEAGSERQEEKPKKRGGTQPLTLMASSAVRRFSLSVGSVVCFTSSWGVQEIQQFSSFFLF